MRDVDANHHGLFLSQNPHFRGVQGMVSTAQLEVEFQAHVGEVLIVGPGKLLVDDANVEDPLLDVACELYAVVDRGHLSFWEDHEDQFWSLGIDGESVDRGIDFGFKVLRSNNYVLAFHAIRQSYSPLSERGLEFVYRVLELLVARPKAVAPMQRNPKVSPSW